MSKMHNVVVPLALLVSVLALSACATKEEPAPVTAAAETSTVPEVAPALADDQHRHGQPEGAAEEPAIVEKPVPEQVAPPPVKKKVVRAKRIPPKAVPPAPVPEPVIAPAPPVEIPAVQPPEPAPPELIAPPAEEVVKKGFLEEYWLWLLGLVVALVGIAVWRLKGQAGKS